MYSDANAEQPVWRLTVNAFRTKALKAVVIFCGLLTVGLWANHSPAEAASTKVIVLSRTAKGIASKQSLWLGKMLRYSLRKQKGLDIPGKAKINQTLYTTPLSASTLADARASMKKMRTFLNKAKKLYQVTVFPLPKRSSYALKALLLADKEAQELPKIMEQPAMVKQRDGLLRELYYYYGLAYMGLKKNKKALKYIHMLVRLAPSFVPSAKVATADYLGVHGVVLKKLKQHRYALKIDSVPSGGKVYLDHRFVGRAPVTLTNLMAGRHTIRITKMKYKVWERVANLNPKKLGARKSLNVKIPLKLDPKSLTVIGIPLYAKGAIHSDDILDRLEQITSKLSANFLYVVEPQVSKKGSAGSFTLRVAIYKKGYRTIYYQNLPLGSSLSSSGSRIQAYSSKVRQQVTTNFFKKPKPIK